MGGNSTLEEFGKNLTTFRFAVLHHQLGDHAQRNCHWDLLLEPPTLLTVGLLTFEINSPPTEWANHKLVITRLPDHRPLYLDYEGPISGDRGQVKRVLAGTIQWRIFEQDLLVLTISPAWPIESETGGLMRFSKSPAKQEDRWELEWKPRLRH